MDLDPQRIQEAQANAVRAGVADQGTFRVPDIFDTDIQPATVVTLFLSPELNARLRPKLTSQLRPGRRIASHRFDIGDWVPERTSTLKAVSFVLLRRPRIVFAAPRTRPGDREKEDDGLSLGRGSDPPLAG